MNNNLKIKYFIFDFSKKINSSLFYKRINGVLELDLKFVLVNMFIVLIMIFTISLTIYFSMANNNIIKENEEIIERNINLNAELENKKRMELSSINNQNILENIIITNLAEKNGMSISNFSFNGSSDSTEWNLSSESKSESVFLFLEDMDKYKVNLKFLSLKRKKDQPDVIICEIQGTV